MTISEDLRKQFEAKDVAVLKHKENAKYITGFTCKERVLDATKGEYMWVIKSCYLEMNSPQLMKGVTCGLWVVHGTLTIPELGSWDAIGTAPAFNEDAAKAAATDAFKVAASYAGVALDLYDKDWVPAYDAPKQQATRAVQSMAMQTPSAGVYDGSAGEQCPKCHAPTGKLHGKPCNGK